MFLDSDDDLPEVPTTDQVPSSLAEKQARHFEELQSQLDEMKKQPRRSVSKASPSSSVNEEVEGTHDAMLVSEEEEVQIELRRLVPHLSQSFHCSFRDAVLILNSIRHGGNDEHSDTLENRLQQLDTEKRTLEHRVQAKTDEVENLKNDVAQARGKVEAIQQDAKRSTSQLAQRREELRKQLLLEEGRSQKLQMRVKQLELENNQLKDRIRGHRL